MITKLQKWGNSQGVRINKSVLEQTGLSVGDPVDVVAKSGLIVLKPKLKRRKKYNLKELVDKMPSRYRPQEFDWGEPQGKEVW